MNENIDRRAYLLTDYTDRKIRAAQHHRFQTADHVLCAVSVPRRQTSVMPGIHRLRISSASLPAPRPLRSDWGASARGTDQIAYRDFSRPSVLAFRVSSDTRFGTVTIFNSAESSIVMTRSSGGIYCDNAFRKVVFPEPVPPPIKCCISP